MTVTQRGVRRNAIAPSSRAVWEKELAPEFLYVDEKMGVMDRAGFLNRDLMWTRVK